jgi:parvulin-like peptidyl-prolyl isomerase
MQDLIRKHRTAFGVVILLVIGVPMIFFGLPNFFGDGNRVSREEIAIGTVGDVPLKAMDFDQMISARRQGPDGSLKELSELEADGTVDKVLEQMVNGAIITNIEKQRGFEVGKDLLTTKLKDYQDFKDDEGNFDKKVWNDWVQNPAVNWNEIYASVNESISRQVFLDMALAPAGRLLESDITKELETKFSTLKVKYYAVLPVVEPTQEQMKAVYDKEVAKVDGKPKYQKPDQYVVDYASFSLQVPVPPLALEIVTKARGGEDFATLADTHSALKAKNGGEMGGWQRERENESEQRKSIFKLKPGEVSDPVASSLGYYIYKVDEERTAEDGVREVKARQIFVEAKMTEEERAAVVKKAADVVEKAKTVGLVAAVDEYNLTAIDGKLEIKRSPKFDRESEAVEGIGRMDLVRFRTGFETLAADTKVASIEAGQNIYVAEVVEKTPGVVPPFEEVIEDVKKDAIRDLKMQDDYKAKVKEYADKIKAQVTNIDEIPAKFPELTGVVGESDEFKVKEFIVKIPQAASGDRPFIPSEKVAAALEGREPGAFAGPIDGFGGNDAYFVQLLDRKPATEEDRKEFDAERKNIRQQRMNQAKNDLMQDLTKDLRERTNKEFLVNYDQMVLGEILGRGKPAEAPAAEAPAAEAPAANAPAAEAPAAEAPAAAPAQ